MSAIVVGYDGTEGARAALAAAAEMARDLDAALVVVFSHATSRLGGEVRDYNDALREYRAGVLAQAAGLVGDVPVQTESLDLEPVAGLLDAAERHDARMIVVGSYGEAPLKSALVGSTPTKLLHLSTRPVLVVPAGA